jgi:hypothetical protein
MSAASARLRFYGEGRYRQLSARRSSCHFVFEFLFAGTKFPFSGTQEVDQGFSA